MIKFIEITQIHILLISSLAILLIHSFPSHNKKTHPIILIINLLLLITISTINLTLLKNTSLLPFILFIIIIGGMIIIFIYFISFINNIKTSIKWKNLLTYPIKILFFLIGTTLILIKTNQSNWTNNFIETNPIWTNLNPTILNNINKLYIHPISHSTIISIIYIFICLTLIVKFIIKKKKSLRKLNYEKINFQIKPNPENF